MGSTTTLAESRSSVAPDHLDRIDYLIATLGSIDGVECDPSPMGVLSRIGHVFEAVEQMLEAVVRNEHVRHKKDHDLLVLLLQSDRPLKNQQLEKLLRITAPSVSQRVGRLVAAGLIERTPDPNDTRANQLSLTELGRKVTIASVEKAIVVQRAILEASFAEDDIAIMENLLRRLNRSLGDAPTQEHFLNTYPN